MALALCLFPLIFDDTKDLSTMDTKDLKIAIAGTGYVGLSIGGRNLNSVPKQLSLYYG